jgi:hypothetical protein
VLLRTFGGPASNEDTGTTRLLWGWQIPGSGSGSEQPRSKSQRVASMASPSFCSSTADAPRCARVYPCNGMANPRSRAAPLHPRAMPTGVVVRYQEVAAVFIRVCPCPAICTLAR